MKVLPVVFAWAAIFIFAFFAITDFNTSIDVKNDEPATKNKITGNAVNINPDVIQKSVEISAPAKAEIVLQGAVDYSTFVSDLKDDEMVKDLPKSAVLNLKTYNFNSGTRGWEKSFTITRDSITKGSPNSDIQIIIHSKYVEELKTKSLCSVLSSAQANGDFAADTQMSESSLIWKYKSMMKYRNCLGL